VELIGLYLIAAGLLVVAGVAKVLRPDDSARALAALAGTFALRRVRLVVRAGALAEAVLGVTALVLPRSVTAALVALSYAAFGAVVVTARRRGGPLATCGCFARPDTPPTTVHVVLDIMFAAVALVVAVTAPSDGTLTTELARQPWAGIPLVFVSTVGLWLSLLAFSSLAALEGARRLAGPVRNEATTS
jgi:hypothetical protein